MRPQKLLSLLVCTCWLAACATEGGPVVAPTSAARPSMLRIVAEADAASAAGQSDQAYTLLKGGAATYPADKTPWLRMAQMRFDRNNYSDAIVNAQEALRRDPDDKQANGIVLLGGLRLSARAMADLARKNNVSAPLRAEARDLTRVLRTGLGDEVAVAPAAAASKSGRGGSGKAVREPPAGKAKANPPAAAAAADPFGGLK